MVDIARVRVAWSGSAIVGGGVSTFYSTGTGSVLADAVETFWDATKSYRPAGASCTIPAEGDVLNSSTGELVGGWSGGPGTSIAGTGAGEYAKGVGARVVWNTNGFTNGRRVRGSTYLVPLVASMFAIDGTINDAVRTNIIGFAEAFRTTMGGDFVIWTRPTAEHIGGVNSTTSASCPDTPSWLRTRRT